MSTINPSIPSAYTNLIGDTRSQILQIQSQLNSGTKNLSASDQSTITTLSANVTAYSTAATNITNAQSVVSSAQSGLVSVAQKLNQMQVLANQATNPLLSNLDAVEINRRFQQLVTDIGKIATSAGVNGNNLLSGTGGMYVNTGIDSSPSSLMFIKSVNVYGMVMMGSLSNIRLESLADANKAVTAIRSALSTISNGQIFLSNAAKQLGTQSSNIDTSLTSINNQVSNLQTLDKPALQAQLSILNSRLSVYTLLSKLA